MGVLLPLVLGKTRNWPFFFKEGVETELEGGEADGKAQDMKGGSGEGQQEGEGRTEVEDEGEEDALFSSQRAGFEVRTKNT